MSGIRVNEMNPFGLTAGVVGFIGLTIQLSSTAKQLFSLWASESLGITDLKAILEGLGFLFDILDSVGGREDYTRLIQRF